VRALHREEQGLEFINAVSVASLLPLGEDNLIVATIVIAVSNRSLKRAGDLLAAKLERP
jgi:hypothetical protein